ncbi:RHS repeat-associated core domain-containing protein [Thiolapillus sp.]|uniref:RHS repeat-associated core domain-containing protein n=1 Tax=Thiolapillus sp. TaxID=2017437 RepID=UPI003AF51055
MDKFNTRSLILTALVLMPGVGMSDPRYAGGDYLGGLIHLGVRDLNPRLSRFTTPDPANQFMSGYQYGAAAPVTHADPSGAMMEVTSIMMTELSEDTAPLTEAPDGAATAEHTQKLAPSAKDTVKASRNSVTLRRSPRMQVPPQNQWGARYLRLPAPLNTTMHFLERAESRLSDIEAQMRLKARERDAIPSGLRNYYKRMTLERHLRDLSVRRSEYLGQQKYYRARLMPMREQAYDPRWPRTDPWVSTYRKPPIHEIPTLSAAPKRRTIWDRIIHVLSQYPGRNWHY